MFIQGPVLDVLLTRLASNEVADRRRMLELFAALKVNFLWCPTRPIERQAAHRSQVIVFHDGFTVMRASIPPKSCA